MIRGRPGEALAPLDAGIAARSTWHADCPVTLDELRYVALVHVGFDGRTHPGELIVHRDVVYDVVEAFRALHAARLPIEEVRIIEADEPGLPPTCDGTTTTGFVRRAMVSGARCSEHAFGRAIDVNPSTTRTYVATSCCPSWPVRTPTAPTSGR